MASEQWDSQQSCFFTKASVAAAMIAWMAGLLVPILAASVFGVSLGAIGEAGGDDMSPDQFGAFVVAAVLAFCGFTAIVGVVLGLLGASLASRCRPLAVGAIVINALAWIGVATFFMATYGG